MTSRVTLLLGEIIVIFISPTPTRVLVCKQGIFNNSRDNSDLPEAFIRIPYIRQEGCWTFRHWFYNLIGLEMPAVSATRRPDTSVKGSYATSAV